jgi:hypothetical protein
MLYYIQEIEPPFRIKIGFSEKPLDRIATLAATLPQKVQILKITPGEREDESWMHERWRAYRVEGKREWYYPAPELLDEIDAPNTKF